MLWVHAMPIATRGTAIVPDEASLRRALERDPNDAAGQEKGSGFPTAFLFLNQILRDVEITNDEVLKLLRGK